MPLETNAGTKHTKSESPVAAMRDVAFSVLTSGTLSDEQLAVLRKEFVESGVISASLVVGVTIARVVTEIIVAEGSQEVTDIDV